MHKKGIVFDFNGTLFWDTELHNRAWDKYLITKGKQVSDQDKNAHMHGRTSHDIFEYLTGRILSKDEVAEMTEEKEAIYRAECEKQVVSLAPGAKKLLGLLVKMDVPIGIATASGKSNVDYFIQKFELRRFFPKDAIIYDNGEFPGKPDPALYLKVISNLEIRPQDTLIFEDSIAGIQSAENAGADQIIIVNSTGQDYAWSKHSVIENYAEFDLDSFLSSM